MERRRAFLVGSVFFLASCGPIRTTEQQRINNFANSVANGDINSAVLLVDAPASQARDRVESLRKDLINCQIMGVDISNMPKGAVIPRKATITLDPDCRLDRFEVGLTGSGRQIKIHPTHWTRVYRTTLVQF